MRSALRFILIPLLGTLLAGGIAAQEAPAAETSTAAATTETAVVPPAEAPAMTSSHEVRDRFAELLRNHPRELGTVLALDPSLMSNETFLAGYPAVAAFLGEHPEVRRNPRFYLQGYGWANSSIEQVTEPFLVAAIFALIAFALGWLVLTIIEQKRWNRMSKIQTEVHNKILDRFGTSAELLEYIKTPAGSKFLESAPIPLHAEQPSRPAQPRALWSIQAGIVIAAAAIGMLLVSSRLERESAEGMFALGMIGLSIGIGFVASAAVSIVLSKRLAPPPDGSDRLDLVR